MMKIVLALCILGASAVAPPRIELDLSQNTLLEKSALQNKKLYTNLRHHIEGDAQHDLEGGNNFLTTPEYNSQGAKTGDRAIKSRQDWSQQCPANGMTSTNCPSPTCRAYDHNDKDVPCHENVYLIDFENKDTYKSQSLPLKMENAAPYSAEFANKRATWLFKYDAVDGAGNRAEQVVFALILNDVQAPVITNCYGGSGANPTKITIEAAAQNPSNGKFEPFCVKDAKRSKSFIAIGTNTRTARTDAGVSPAASSSSYSAQDTIDGLVSDNISFKVFTVRNTAAIHGGSLDLAGVRTQLNSILPGGADKKFVVEAKVHDNAGYYGEDGKDNESDNFVDVDITDTRGPLFHYQGQALEYGECCRTGATDCDKEAFVGYNEQLHYATDANDGDVSASIKLVGRVTTVTGEVLTSDAIKAGNGFTVDITSTTDLAAPKTVYQFVTDAKGNAGFYWDASGKGTKYAKRNVAVVDRIAPKLKLTGDLEPILESKVEHYNNSATYIETQEGGFDYSDTCIPNSGLKCTMEWQGGEPDFQVLQDYTRVYTCCDRAPYNLADAQKICDGVKAWTNDGQCCSNAAGKAVPCCTQLTRKFSMVDAEAPTIKVMGSQALTIDASNTEEYTDAGATCQDYVDGVLSHAVEVSGEVVDMRKTGSYTIRYDCTDLSGHAAQYQTRVVTVVDRTAPKVTLKGAERVYIEAGFRYEDAGYEATDDLDGDISGARWVDGVSAGCEVVGDTVNDSCQYFQKTSCKEIAAECPSCKSGQYCVSGFDSSTQRSVQLQVWCDMVKGSEKTLLTVNDGILAIPEAAGNDNSCKNFGAEWGMAVFTNAVNRENALIEFNSGANKDKYFPQVISGKTSTEQQGQYLCSPNDEASTVAASQQTPKQGGAEVGEFTIKYRCKDAAGNKDEDWESQNPIKRIVIVKDTLAPVISLHLNKQMIASSKNDNSPTYGLGNERNPAEVPVNSATGLGNPNLSLMAENTASSVNGWIIGALASAVSGLALLGYSLRKTNNVVTSVPV